MYHKDKVVGLVLGSGMLAQTLVKNCKKKKIRIHIISLENSFELEQHKPDLILEYDKIGNIFKYLKNNHISQVVFLGKVKKKSLYKIRPNLVTLYYLLRLSLNYNTGDGRLINKILGIFYKKKIKVLDPRIFLQKNLCTKRDKNNSKLNHFLSNKKISEFFLLAKKYSEKDLGQSVIVSNNKIILGEDKRGTDFLIRKFKDLKFRDPAFLVKVTKPHQSLKVDLPTIGPTTVNNILAAGLKGIIVEDKKTFVENPSLTFKIIKKNKLFYYAH